jgi:hypothetical protein
VVAHAFNPSTRSAEAGEFLSSRPAWSTEWVPGQPGLYKETLSRKKKKSFMCRSISLNMCVHTPHTCRAHGGQEEALDSLERDYGLLGAAM